MARQLTGAALTAKLIKKTLSSLYPKVKFSVRSDVFSMGDSVDIRWTDGPTQDAVEAIAKQYQHGNFNGMIDMYEYESIDPSLGCDGAKYVQCHRTTSPKHKAMLAAKADEHFGKLDPNDHSYHRRLAEIEKMFFPYPAADPKPCTAIAQGNGIVSGLEIKIIDDVDTRDDSKIYVVKIITKVADFASLREEMKSLGGYYSKYKRGFIFKEDPTAALKGDSEATDIGKREEISA